MVTDRAGRRRRLARTAAAAIGTALAALAGVACGGGSSGERPAAADQAEEAEQPAGEPVRVGVLAIRAGAGAVYGQAGERATRWWAERVNAAGGILGRPVELVGEEEATPQETVARFRKLVLRDRVEVVFGITSTAASLAVAPVAEQMGVPLLMWDGTTQNGVDETMPDPKWVFRSPDNETEATAAAILTARHFPDVKKVAGINNDYSYGKDTWTTYQAVLRKLVPGVTFADGMFTKLGETDFSAQIAALRASGADLIMSSFWSNDAAVFLKQAAATSLFDGKRGVLAVAGGLTGSLTKDLVPEGVLLGYNTMYFDHPERSELLAEFVDDYHADHGGYPGHEADAAYFVAEAWRAAVEQVAAENNDEWPALDAVAAALEGIEVESLSGPRRMREDHVAEARFFQGVTTHDNAYDFVTLDPVETLPTDRVMKPSAGTDLLAWIARWELAADGLPEVKGR